MNLNQLINEYMPAGRNEYDKLIASLRKLIAIVELYHREAGDCDHSVGICLCGEKRDLEEAKELLAKLQ